MVKRLPVVLLVSMALAFSSTMALADQIRLKNGDRISGTILRMEQGKLLVKTDFAGEIGIDWEQVAGLSAGDALRVVLSDDSALVGEARNIEDGKLALKTEALSDPLTIGLAQVKAINPAVRPSLRVKGIANAGLTSESGNTDADSIRIDGSVVARTEQSRYTLGGEVNQEKADGVDTVKNWLAYANYDYFFAPKWFWYVRTDFENDDFADLNLRSTLGTGFGYQAFESELLNLSFSAGPSYVDENFEVADDDSFVAGQWLINYDQFFFDKFVQVFHRQNGHVSLDDTGNWILKTRQGLRFPVYKGLTATLQYNYDYFNEPSVAAREDYDSALLFLLGWQFSN